MTVKRTNESVALIEAEHDEMPLRKRIKIQADFDAKRRQQPEQSPLMMLLAEVALAEVSDDDASHRTHDDDDASHVSMESHLPKLTPPKVASMMSMPSPLPAFKPLAAPGRLAPVPAWSKSNRFVTSLNYNPVGNPLTAAPRLFQPTKSKIVLQKIDSTLSTR